MHETTAASEQLFSKTRIGNSRYHEDDVEPASGCINSGQATGAGGMEKPMNVLQMIRNKALKLDALKQAQVAAVKAPPVFLVYRGNRYQKVS